MKTAHMNIIWQVFYVFEDPCHSSLPLSALAALIGGFNWLPTPSMAGESAPAPRRRVLRLAMVRTNCMGLQILRLHRLAILGLHRSSTRCHFYLQHSNNQRMSFDDKSQSFDDKSQSFDNKSQSFEDKSQSFDDKSQNYVEEDHDLGRGSASSYASSLQSNFQHHLFRELLGYLIHPSILSSSNLPSNPKIADIVAGTGQWLIDGYRLLPSAHLDGLDISKEQYPSDAWLPA